MRLTRKEIQLAVKNPEWQKLRLYMKGKPTGEKMKLLATWRGDGVVVQNYLNALKRGGLIK